MWRFLFIYTVGVCACACVCVGVGVSGCVCARVCVHVWMSGSQSLSHSCIFATPGSQVCSQLSENPQIHILQLKIKLVLMIMNFLFDFLFVFEAHVLIRVSVSSSLVLLLPPAPLFMLVTVPALFFSHNTIIRTAQTEQVLMFSDNSQKSESSPNKQELMPPRNNIALSLDQGQFAVLLLKCKVQPLA